MSKDSESSRIQVIGIVLGFVGVVITVLATIFAPILQERFKQNQTPIVIVESPTLALSTQAISPGAPTSVPATNTPEPAFTFTAIPPVVIGEDWLIGCISVLWQPYPTDAPLIDKGNGCWQEPVFVFSADEGRLAFLGERNGAGPQETFGLFAPLPERGTVTFKVRLGELRNVDFVMGVFSEADLDAPGLIMTIPAGSVQERPVVQKDDMTSYETLQTTTRLAQGAGYSFTFTFNDFSVGGAVNPNVFVIDPLSLPSAQKWLFLGYKGLNGSYRIEGEALGFELK